MESISVSGEVGGAGGAYSYKALKRLDQLWSKIFSAPKGSKSMHHIHLELIFNSSIYVYLMETLIGKNLQLLKILNQ